MTRRIVVSGNCQSRGIADLLGLIFPEDDVQAYINRAGETGSAELDELLAAADIWVALTPDSDQVVTRAAPRTARLELPSVSFAGFHPDVVYAVFRDGGVFNGVSEYHSAIGLWAWQRGLDPPDAARLFSADTYAALGYYSYYRTGAEHLRLAWERVGLDFPEFWLRAQRLGVFMQVVNHPRGAVLALLAKQIAMRIGAERSVFSDPLELYLDEPLRAVIWPVYPEIARHLGVPGSTRFRMRQRWLPSLPAFLEAQWDAYGDTDPESLHAVRDNLPHYDAVLEPLVSARGRARA